MQLFLKVIKIEFIKVLRLFNVIS